MFTIGEAAKYKSVSPQSIRDALKRGAFPNAKKEPEHKERGIWYIPQSDLDNWKPRKYPRKAD